MPRTSQALSHAATRCKSRWSNRAGSFLTRISMPFSVLSRAARRSSPRRTLPGDGPYYVASVAQANGSLAEPELRRQPAAACRANRLRKRDTNAAGSDAHRPRRTRLLTPGLRQQLASRRVGRARPALRPRERGGARGQRAVPPPPDSRGGRGRLQRYAAALPRRSPSPRRRIRARPPDTRSELRRPPDRRNRAAGRPRLRACARVSAQTRPCESAASRRPYAPPRSSLLLHERPVRGDRARAPRCNRPCKPRAHWHLPVDRRTTLLGRQSVRRPQPAGRPHSHFDVSPILDPEAFVSQLLSHGQFGSALGSGVWTEPQFLASVRRAATFRGSARRAAYHRLEQELLRAAPVAAFGSSSTVTISRRTLAAASSRKAQT